MTTVPAEVGSFAGGRAARLVAHARRSSIAVAVLLLGVTWWYHTRLVTASEAVDAARAQVENVLKRRADLIPALVAVTAAHARGERALLDSVSAARPAWSVSSARAAPADDMRTVDALTQRLLAVGERYPQLQASRTYTQLRFELLGTENRVATERARYAEAVLTYRTLRRSWPSSIVARVFDLPDLPSY